VAARDAQARRHLREALARAGYQAVVHADSRVILEHRQTEGLSFLLLEGAEADMKAVRTLRERGATLPVIVLFGGPVGDKRLDEWGAGPLERLPTPFTLKTLQRAIAKVLK
jgi:DNA-binding NtrC family response regulator